MSGKKERSNATTRARGTGSAIGALTALNVLGALIALLNSILTATLFGTKREMEVFFAAATMLALIMTLTQTGQLAEAFLPMYHRIKHVRGASAAFSAFSVVITWMFAVTVCLGVLLATASPVLIKLLVPGFSYADRAMAVKMFCALLPLVVIQTLFSLFEMIANAERWFGRPEAVSVAGRLMILISFGALARPAGVWSNVYSLWIGQSLQLAAYLIMLRNMGYTYSPRLKSEGFSRRGLFSKLLGTGTYVGAVQIYGFVLNAGLSLLPQGSYAVFKYVEQLYAKSTAAILRPISVVFFTHFSEALAQGAHGVRVLARISLSRCLAIVSVSVVSALVAGDFLLRGLWGSKHFGHDELRLATNLLWVYSVLTYTTGIGLIARKVNMALGMVQRQYLCAAAAHILSAGIVWFAIRHYGIQGAIVGIALAVSAVNLSGLGVLALSRRELLAFYPMRHVFSWLVAGVAAYVCGALFSHVLSPYVGAWRVAQFAMAGILSVIVVCIMCIIAWILGVPEVVAVALRLAPTRVATTALAHR